MVPLENQPRSPPLRASGEMPTCRATLSKGAPARSWSSTLFASSGVRTAICRQWTASGSSNSALCASYQARVSAAEARSARVCSATYFSARRRSRVSSESCSGLRPARARCSPHAAPLLRVSSASASVARCTSASLTDSPAAFARCSTSARSISASSTALACLGTSCGATFASPLSSDPSRIRSSSTWTRLTGMGEPFTVAAARGGAGAGGGARRQACTSAKRPTASSAPLPPRSSPAATRGPGGMPVLVSADLRRCRRRRLLRRRGGHRRKRLRGRVDVDARLCRRSRRLRRRLHLDLLQLLLVEGDLGALAQLLHPLVVIPAPALARHPLPDRLLALIEGAAQRHRLHLELHHLDAGGRVQRPRLVAWILQVERSLGQLRIVGLRELVLGEEAQIAAHRRRERVLALFHGDALEGIHLPLLLARVDLFQQRRCVLARLGALLGVGGRQEEVQHARALGLHELVDVRLVELLQLLLRNVDPRQLGVELVLDQLLDHRPLHLLADSRALVVALADRLLREQLVADHVLQELLLALERAVAGAQEGTGLVQPLADLVGGDDLIAHPGDGGARLLALLAGGGGGEGDAQDAGKTGVHAADPSQGDRGEIPDETGHGKDLVPLPCSGAQLPDKLAGSLQDVRLPVHASHQLHSRGEAVSPLSL